MSNQLHKALSQLKVELASFEFVERRCGQAINGYGQGYMEAMRRAIELMSKSDKQLFDDGVSAHVSPITSDLFRAAVQSCYDRLREERTRIGRCDSPKPGPLSDLLMATERDLQFALDLEFKRRKGGL
jgi:hypothetical protein